MKLLLGILIFNVTGILGNCFVLFVLQSVSRSGSLKGEQDKKFISTERKKGT
jgi:hypothetical protein